MLRGVRVLMTCQLGRLLGVGEVEEVHLPPVLLAGLLLLAGEPNLAAAVLLLLLQQVKLHLLLGRGVEAVAGEDLQVGQERMVMVRLARRKMRRMVGGKRRNHRGGRGRERSRGQNHHQAVTRGGERWNLKRRGRRMRNESEPHVFSAFLQLNNNKHCVWPSILFLLVFVPIQQIPVTSHPP